MSTFATFTLCALSLAPGRSIYRTPVEATGALDPAELEGLRLRVDAQVERSQFELLVPTDPDACEDDPCWQASASGLDAAYRLAVHVDATEADQRLTLTVTNVIDGATVVQTTQTCELCGREELLDAVADLTATGLRKLQTVAIVSTTLSVDSVPAGANARVDGVQVGTTPVQVTVTPGPHTVELSTAGHDPLTETVDVERGTSERVRLHLSPSAAVVMPDVDEPPLRRGRVVVGATLVAGGVLAVAAGITLLVLHRRPITSDCSGADVDADGDCHFLHDTQAGGFASVAAGGAAVIGGAVVLGIETRRGRLALHPSPTGVFVRF